MMRLNSLVLLLSFGMASCAASQAPLRPSDAPHLGEEWWSWRASTLGITPAQARERDAALPDAEGPPPMELLDEHTARESAALWRELCASCHGLDGTPPPQVEGGVVPRPWGFGSRMGFTFGGDAMRRSIYLSISRGKPRLMPAWDEVLAREQIWALVRHVEGF